MTTTPKRELSATKRALLEQRLGPRLEERAVAPPSRIPRRPPGSAPPLSFAQERVWFMEQYAPGTAAYATPIVVHLRGELDEDALQRALDAVALRHEPLRTTFPATADGRPRVRIGAAGLPVERVEAGPEGVLAVLRAAAARPFDLAGGPLMRVLLARLGDRDHLLALAGHHVIGDGWSSDVLVADLMELYRSARTGAPARLPELPL